MSAQPLFPKIASGQRDAHALNPCVASDSCLAPTPQLASGALHEFYGARHAEATSLLACALMLAQSHNARPKLWVRHGGNDREAGTPVCEGLAELGIDPARIVFVQARDVQSALQAGLEGARCATLGAVIIELWGETSSYDLTASRRLALAAKVSGTRVLMVRAAAEPHPSAAETRWLGRAARSRALEANAPGYPAFHLTLLRARNGQEGLQYDLEWNRDDQRFENRVSIAGETGRTNRPAVAQPASVSGLVVPVSFDRPEQANSESVGYRRAG